METKLFLENLVNQYGVSGFEYDLADFISSEFSQYADEVTTDKLGNVIALKKGSGNENIKIMLAAHMDEIGLMINYIEDNGFLRFTNVGGIDPRTILGQEVIVHGKERLFGVIGSKPIHLQDQKEQEETVKMQDMIIDIGFSKEEAEKRVRIGDIVTIKREMTELKNNRVYGKAMDNRTGVAVLYQMMKELQKLKHEPDIYFVATVQEEVSMAGAVTSSFSIRPDLGIAVDVGFGKTPELNKWQSIELGEGPGITLGGNIHPGLRKKLIETANEYNIPQQMVVTPGPTGTDARAMQVNMDGIPCLVVDIPLKYMHTSVEVADMDDIDKTAKLLSFYINEIKNDDLEGLLCY